MSADGQAWLLLNASPDLRQQIIASPWLHPRGEGRHSPIAGVFLTNGDVDHIAGLLSLREQQRFALYAARATLDILGGASVFDVLDRRLVERVPIEPGAAVDTGIGLAVTAFTVPGKVPLYLEGTAVTVGAEDGAVLGLDITDGSRRLVYIPGCAEISASLITRVEGADLLFFDGTTFTDDELVALGLSAKTARRMGHLAIGGADGSMRRFAGARIGRKVYIHINNTNPILVEGSRERMEVEAAGWEVAFDGMEIAL